MSQLSFFDQPDQRPTGSLRKHSGANSSAIRSPQPPPTEKSFKEFDFATGRITVVPASRQVQPSPKPQPLESAPREEDPSAITWRDKGESVRVAGHEIECGNFYTAGKMVTTEPSAIDASLEVRDSFNPLRRGIQPRTPLIIPQRNNDSLSYARFTPEERYEYLAWLSRSHSKPQLGIAKDKRFPVLFYYGIERRILVDGDYSPEIGSVLTDLLTQLAGPSGLLVGGVGLGKSIESLLLHWAHSQGAARFLDTAEKLFNVPSLKRSSGLRKLYLSCLSQLHMPLMAESAAMVYFADHAFREFDEAFLKTYRTTFTEYFENTFVAGVTVAPVEHPCQIAHEPLNRTLAWRRWLITSPGGEPSPEDSQTLRNMAAAAFETANDSLSPSADNSFDFSKVHPLRKNLVLSRKKADLDASLEDIVDLEGVSMLPAVEISEALNVQSLPTDSASGGIMVRQLLGEMGYVIEPEPRYHTIHSEDSYVALLKAEPIGEAEAGNYMLWCAFSHLFSIIPSESEEFDDRCITSLKGWNELSPNLKVRIRAYARLIKAKGERLAGTKATTLAPKIPVAWRPDAAFKLLRLTGSGTTLNEEQVKALLKVVGLLDLPADQKKEARAAVRAARENPVEAPKASNSPLVLDMAKVAAISGETKEVISLLTAAMADEEESASAIKPVPAPAAVSTVNDPAAVGLPQWVQSAPRNVAAMIVELVAQDNWDRKSFVSIAAKSGLMPAAAYDLINTWAEEALGDILLEGQDPLTVYTDLIPVSQ